MRIEFIFHLAPVAPKQLLNFNKKMDGVELAVLEQVYTKYRITVPSLFH